MSRPSRYDIEQGLERFIVDELLEDRYDGRDPLATKAVDSLGIEQLISYIQEEYGVALADREIVEESFESLAALAALVDAKLDGVRR